jgi:hypothetical protein
VDTNDVDRVCSRLYRNETALKIVLVGFAVAGRVFDLFGADFKRTGRARMRAVNGHDLGADDPSADPNLDHFTVDRFSWLVLCLGKLEFRFAQLPRFDVPDILTRQLFSPLFEIPDTLSHQCRTTGRLKSKIIWIERPWCRAVNPSSDHNRVARRRGRRVPHGRPCWHQQRPRQHT